MHNARPYIDRTLDSIFAQTYRHFELIVIDDGSTDGSADRVLARASDSRLHYFRRPNRGLGSARVDSLKMATGDLIAFIDHDDTWQPGKLDAQVSVMRTRFKAGCCFTDTAIVDQDDRCLRHLSDAYPYAAIDLSAGEVHYELIRRGCFIALSSAMVRRSALDHIGGMSRAYRYVGDFDLWLRLSRLFDFAFVNRPLTHWRSHSGQFTVRMPDVSAQEHQTLLLPIVKSPSYPRHLRQTAADFVLGQVRANTRTLLSHGRLWRALRTAARALRPVSALGRYAYLKIVRRPWNSRDAQPVQIRSLVLDGSPLSEAPAGYFNHIAELVREVLVDESVTLTVVAEPRGWQALGRRLGLQLGQVISTQMFVWRKRGAFNSILRPLLTIKAAGPLSVAEVITWKMRFHRRKSLRVAIIADMTPILLPETHTAGNIRDFVSLVEHVNSHANVVATVSEHSRRDILARLSLCPSSVHVVRMPLNPVYTRPSVQDRHRSPMQTILTVGTIEPRKNLRRLVRVSARLAQHDRLQLVIIGSLGWDPGWTRFLSESNATHVTWLGFVPDDELARWYERASVFVYPSLYEGFGLPLLEAMSSGAVIAAANRASIPEVVGDAALFFDPEDEEDMLSALRTALHLTDSEAHAMSSLARRRARALTDAASRPILPFPPFSRTQ